MQESANTDRKSLQKSITRGHLKPGVLMPQCIIHLIIDFRFNFHRYVNPDALIPFLFIALSWQQEHPISFHFTKTVGEEQNEERGGKRVQFRL